jgi:thiosulfate/3-mercaptopyruvate sulfurtransferase
MSLISCNELLEEIKVNKNLIIADVRWYPNLPDKPKEMWLLEHLPSAIFIDLDNELSDHSIKNAGRHPLPNPEKLVKDLSKKGIGQNSIIVAYDDNFGAISSRLWWLMKWINGPQVKILDGGIQAWKELNLPLESGKFTLKENNNVIKPKINSDLLVNKEYIFESIKSDKSILLDARDNDRYLGKTEPIDPVAGHIETAINAFFKGNLTQETNPKFQNSEQLKNRFESLGVNQDKEIICYCGSGVTACHNLLALDIAGIKNAKLYAGSWSEWCTTMI